MTVGDMFRRNTLTKRLISLLIASTFILSNIAQAAPQADNQDISKPRDIVTNPDKIIIPRDNGLVKSKFAGNSDKLIVHIQDAHCNFEAQTNIAKILENLVKNYNLSLVSVEGADGAIDTAWFKAFPDEEVRKEVAGYFMKKGEITGPEFLSITTDLPIKLFGAETRSYYIENLNAFTSSYPLKADTEKYFNDIKAALNKLKDYIYSADLKAMDTKSQEYEAKAIQFNDYIRFLQDKAEKNRINLRSYENLFKLVSVLVYEKKIDFNQTDKERNTLIDELSKKLTKDEITELVAQSMSFKVGKLSSTEYYSYLRSTAMKNDIDVMARFPNLYNYIIYNAVYSKIENEKLFHDIRDVEKAIKEKLFANDDQRTLEKLSRHIDTLLGLVNIKLMNGDFDYFKTHKDEFAHDTFTGFIKKKAAQYGLVMEIDPPAETIANSIVKLEDFYAIAVKRDKALVDNTLNEMDRQKQSIAVLVTGGFHSEGMAKLLEKQGISYIVVCPTITKDVPTPYIQILTNQRTPIEDILTAQPEARKGALAAISIAQLAPLSDDHVRAFLAEVLKKTPPEKRAEIEALIEKIAERVKNARKNYVALSVQRWMMRILSAPGYNQLGRQLDTMQEAYAMAMRKGLEGMVLARKKAAAATPAAKEAVRLETEDVEAIAQIMAAARQTRSGDSTFEEIFADIHARVAEPTKGKFDRRFAANAQSSSTRPGGKSFPSRSNNAARRAIHIEQQHGALLEIFNSNNQLLDTYIEKARIARGLKNRDEVIYGMFDPNLSVEERDAFAGRIRATKPPSDKKTILAFGGGTGLLASIRPLAKLGAFVRSIQSSVDDGGSTFQMVTGFIDRGFGWMPSPGDLANSMFEGFAAPDKLYKLLDSQGRIEVDGDKYIYKDDNGAEFRVNSFYELTIKLLKRIAEQTIVTHKGIGYTEKTTQMSDDFAYFAASMLNIARIIDQKYFSHKDGEKSIVPRKGASIRNLVLLGAMDYFGIIDTEKPPYDKFSRKFMLSNPNLSDSNLPDLTQKFQAALDSMAEVAGIDNGRVSLSNNKPATFYSIHHENVIILEESPVVKDAKGKVVKAAVLRVMTVKVEKDSVTVRVLDDSHLNPIVLNSAHGTEITTVGGLSVKLIRNDEGHFSFSVNDSSMATLVEPKEIENTYVTYGDENEEHRLATDGTGMMRFDPDKNEVYEYKPLNMNGKNVYIRSRFTAMQTHATETISFSTIEDAGLVKEEEDPVTERIRNKERPLIIYRPDPKRRVAANEEIVRQIESESTKGIVFGPGSLLTSILPHFLVEGVADALAERRKKGDISIALIINPSMDNETVGLSISDILHMIEEKSGHKIDDLFTDLVINKCDAIKLEEKFLRPEDNRPQPAIWYVNRVLDNPELIEELGLVHFQHLIQKFTNSTGTTSHILKGARDLRFSIQNDDGTILKSLTGETEITLQEYLEVKFDEYLRALYEKPEPDIRTDPSQASKEAKKSRGPLLYTTAELNQIKTNNVRLRVYRDIFLAGIEFMAPRGSDPIIPHVGFLSNYTSFVLGEIFGLTSLNKEVAQAYDKAFKELPVDVRTNHLKQYPDDEGMFRLLFTRYRHHIVKQLTPTAHTYFNQLSLDGFRRVIDTVHIENNIAKNERRGLGIAAVVGLPFEGRPGGQFEKIRRFVENVRSMVNEITNNRAEFNRDNSADDLFMTVWSLIRTRNFGAGSGNSMEDALGKIKAAVSTVNSEMKNRQMDGDLATAIAGIAGSQKPFKARITGFHYSYTDGELYFTVEPTTEFVADGQARTPKIRVELAKLPTEPKMVPLHITLGRVTRPMSQRQIEEINNIFIQLRGSDLPEIDVDTLKIVISSHRTLEDGERIAVQALPLGMPGQRLSFDDMYKEVEARIIYNDAVEAANAMGLAREQIGKVLSANINKTMMLNDFAELAGIDADEALINMERAGLARVTNRANRQYLLYPDFFNPEKLKKFAELEKASSSQPSMATFTILRIARIISNSIKAENFIGMLASIANNPSRSPAEVVGLLGAGELFPTITAAWRLGQAIRDASSISAVDRVNVPLTAGDLISIASFGDYEANGVRIEPGFQLSAAVNLKVLNAIREYQSAVSRDMAVGEYNYRGTGTNQTVKQYFEDSFKPGLYDTRIPAFIKERFNDQEPLKAIITNGIGSNDQFMWALVRMYNENRPDGAPVWHHVTTAQDFARLADGGAVIPENTLFVDISRSGSTWEAVEVGARSLMLGFNKRITIANSGSLIAIASKAAENETTRTGKTCQPFVIEINPDIGGHNMHRKTAIYYTIQTIAGMFVPAMNSPVFAGLNDHFDTANDFSKPEKSAAVNLGKFLHSSMRIFGTQHIVLITNTEPLRLAGKEWEQYVRECLSKEDLITMSAHDLTTEPPIVLSNFAGSPSAGKSIAMALLDRSSANYESDRAKVDALRDKMAVIVFTIDSKKEAAEDGEFKGGISPRQQAAFDILWNDMMTVLTGLLRVDENSSPNVKRVREETMAEVGAWSAVRADYANYSMTNRSTKVTVSLCEVNQSSPSVGHHGARIPLTIGNAAQLGRQMVADLANRKMLDGRDRLNLFTGRNDLEAEINGLRNKAYETGLVTRLGWMPQTAVFSSWMHKGLEASLGPLLAGKALNLFFNSRRLSPENTPTLFDQGFKNMDLDIRGIGVINRATIHQTNDAINMYGVKLMAEVSPTVLVEFDDWDEEVRAIIEAFYNAFIEELSNALPGPEAPSPAPAPIRAGGKSFPARMVSAQQALLQEARTAYRYVGVSMGGNKLAVRINDGNNNAIGKTVELRWDDDERFDQGKIKDASKAGEVMDVLADMIVNLVMENNIQLNKIRLVSAGLTGPLDEATGVFGSGFKTPNLPFDKYSFREELMARLTRRGMGVERVKTVNDAKASRNGEKFAPRGKLRGVAGGIVIIGGGINISVGDENLEAGHNLYQVKDPNGVARYVWAGDKSQGRHPIEKGNVGSEIIKKCGDVGRDFLRLPRAAFTAKYPDYPVIDWSSGMRDFEDRLSGPSIRARIAEEIADAKRRHSIDLSLYEDIEAKAAAQSRKGEFERALTPEALTGNHVAISLIKAIASEIGQALAAFIAAHQDKDFVEHLVLVSGINENLGKGVFENDSDREQGLDIFMKAVRQSARDELVSYFGLDKQRVETVTQGIVRSEMEYERELVSYQPTDEEVLAAYKPEAVRAGGKSFPARANRPGASESAEGSIDPVSSAPDSAKVPVGAGLIEVALQQHLDQMKYSFGKTLGLISAGRAAGTIPQDLAVLLVFDDDIDAGVHEVAREAEQVLKASLGESCVGTVRASGQSLLDITRSRISEFERRGMKVAVVTNLRSTVAAELEAALRGIANETNTALGGRGRSALLKLDIDNNNPFSMIGLMDVDLRIGFGLSDEQILGSLNAVAVNGRNVPFAIDDLNNILSGTLALKPIRRENINSVDELRRGEQAALRSM